VSVGEGLAGSAVGTAGVGVALGGAVVAAAGFGVALGKVVTAGVGPGMQALHNRINTKPAKNIRWSLEFMVIPPIHHETTVYA